MLPTSYSGLCAAALAVLTFAAMQVFRDKLGTEGKMSILGGFIGSWFFVFVLTVRVGRWGGGIGWEAKDRVVRADSQAWLCETSGVGRRSLRFSFPMSG